MMFIKMEQRQNVYSLGARLGGELLDGFER